MIKNLPAMQETWVQSLGQEDPLEKEMATHSSTLAWRIPWTEKPGRLQSTGSQSRTRLSDFTFTLFSVIPSLITAAGCDFWARELGVSQLGAVLYTLGKIIENHQKTSERALKTDFTAFFLRHRRCRSAGPAALQWHPKRLASNCAISLHIESSG